MIYSNGDVVRCSHDFFDKNSYGNLNSQSLEDIIKSEGRLKVYNDHLNERYAEICEKCDFNTVGTDDDFVPGMFNPFQDMIYQTLRRAKRTAMKMLRK